MLHSCDVYITAHYFFLFQIVLLSCVRCWKFQLIQFDLRLGIKFYLEFYVIFICVLGSSTKAYSRRFLFHFKYCNQSLSTCSTQRQAKRWDSAAEDCNRTGKCQHWENGKLWSVLIWRQSAKLPAQPYTVSSGCSAAAAAPDPLSAPAATDTSTAAPAAASQHCPAAPAVAGGTSISGRPEDEGTCNAITWSKCRRPWQPCCQERTLRFSLDSCQLLALIILLYLTEWFMHRVSAVSR